MLDIGFLKPPSPMQIDGVEFMDYQNPVLYKELVKKLNENLVEVDGVWKLNDFNSTANVLEEMIIQHTGMLVTMSEHAGAGASVDAGYFNPGNLLNIKGVEDWFSKSQSNIGHAFRVLKTDILKGWVDTSTGKVGGDYSKINFDFFIDEYISDIIDSKMMKLYNVTMGEGLATIILHELGHIFTGFLYIGKTVIDPIISTTAVKLIVDNKKYGKERVDIIRDAFKVLGVSEKIAEKEVEKMSPDQLIVYFAKSIATRDTRRSLSLGTQDRASEIYADLYAVRMGCPKASVAALTSLPTFTKFGLRVTGTGLLISMAGLGVVFPALVALGGVITALSVIATLGGVLTPGDVYETPYRRVKFILRDVIVQLNNNKTISNRDKIKMMADAKEIEKMCEECKSAMEGTVAQRFTSWLINGNDFKAQEFEHYTDELLGHSLSLYKETF